jgi:hypothetical protein
LTVRDSYAILLACVARSVRKSLLPVNTGLTSKSVLSRNAKEHVRFRMERTGGSKTRIILSIWTRNRHGGGKDIFTTGSGEIAIKMGLKNMNVAMARSAGNICVNICAGGVKRNKSC